ncbi:hypothetical protein OG203_11010 [Nocardia sp. NBC_01499]|uniref:hypothetical protein n=1 Tax=Nocardia sp. NBC_01499 TaxID=2903597 RepID=UPI00386C721D
MHRGDDGLLHKPGDRADSYRDPDGKWHRLGDRDGTYRDKTFQLREGRSWVTDPAVREDIAFLSDKGPAEPYEVVDPNSRGKLDELVGQAARQEIDRAAASAAAKAHMKEFGLEKIDQLSEKKIPGLIENRETAIANDPSLNDQAKLAKLERLYEMTDNASKYNLLGTEMVNTSKELGEVGGIAHATDRPDAVLLTPFEGAFDGRDTFDVISFTDNPHPTLILEECKGGSSPLGAADTEKGRAQQGTPEYGERTAAIEKNLARLLSETPEQMRARGVDPNGPEGQQLLKARDQLLRAHAEGTLRVEYNLVHVSRDGTITVSRFNLERDGQSFSLDVIGGIDKARAQDLVRTPEAQALEQAMARAMEDQRARLLQALDPRDREAVLKAVEFAREMAVTGSKPAELRAQALELMERARETLGQDPGQASKELLAAGQHLGRAEDWEFQRSLDILQNLNIDPQLKEVAKDLLTVEIVDRDRAIAASLEVGNREIVAAVAEKVLATRDPQQVQDREKLLQQAVDKVMQLEGEREQGAGTDLVRLLEAHQSVERAEQAVAAEREREARAMKAIGLTPELGQEVAQSLDVDRVQAIEQAREAVSREVVQQHNNIVEYNPALRVPQGREGAFDARAYLLRLEHQPSRFDRERGAFVFELPGREPVLVPYNSEAVRLAAAAKNIQRGLSIESAAVVRLAQIGQGVPAHEVVQTPPTAEELRMRGRGPELDRARERDQYRER